MNKALKIIAWTLLGMIGLLILIVAGYVIYVACQYYRIPDNQALEISNNPTSIVALNTQYSITTYNIGFGAYTHDFSFFMDSGEWLDGTKTTGTDSVAKDRDTVITNTQGAINSISALSPDFAFFQEVDINGDRSHKVNQFEMIAENFEGYGTSSAINFHTAYLLYPLFNPHGANESAIAAFSKYNITDAVRKKYPIDESFPNKFFDLDRCFAVYYLDIDGTDKQLVLINSHMSAYDEGGTIRAQQLELLGSFISAEYEKGNYVIVGGDWNNDIADSMEYFPTGEKTPDWIKQITADDLPEHFAFAQSRNVPTYRSTNIPYTTDKSGNMLNHSAVIDGFLVSDNITINYIENIDNDFMYSDHNPVMMKFTLNA